MFSSFQKIKKQIKSYFLKTFKEHFFYFQKIIKKNKKKNLLQFLLIFLILIGAITISKNVSFKETNLNLLNKNSKQEGIIYFYGNGCSHCETVDKFLSLNKAEEKIIFARLEVFENPYHKSLLETKAKECGLVPEQIGVPFVFDGKDCVMGYIDVIKFFQNQISFHSQKPEQI